MSTQEQNTPTPREFGFYWVKYQNSWTLAERTPEFDSEHIWYIIGSGGAYVESDFEEIVRFESKHL